MGGLGLKGHGVAVRTFASRKQKLVLACAIGAMLFGTQYAAAGSFTWGNTSGGTWSDGANWPGGIAPGATDSAYFNSNAVTPYTVTLSGDTTVNQIRAIYDQFTLDTAAHYLHASSVWIAYGYTGGANAKLSVSGGGGLDASSTVYIGKYGHGEMTLDNATLNCANSYSLVVGDELLQPGSGSDLQSRLKIINGARVTTLGDVAAGVNSASGRIEVSGSTTSVSSSAGDITIGNAGHLTYPNVFAGYSQGELLVSSGAHVSTAKWLYVGRQSGIGSVDLSDAGSSISASVISVGDSLTAETSSGPVIARGVGSLSITNGASLSATSVSIDAVRFGYQGGVGQGTVSGSSSSLSAVGAIVIGTETSAGQASEGTLAVRGGGQVSTSSGLMRVGDAGGRGWLDVADAGSNVSIANELRVGYMLSANDLYETQATGTLSISNGAEVVVTSGDTYLGYLGGVGNASISGSNSKLRLTGSNKILYVGCNGYVRSDVLKGTGTGSMDISSGGQVSSYGLNVGVEGGLGTLNVHNAGSTVNVTYLQVGGGKLTTTGGAMLSQGQGTVSVSDQGNITGLGALTIGNGSGAGRVYVDGNGSAISFSYFWTGFNAAGEGSLIIQNGGNASFGSTSHHRIGYSGGAGYLEIDGSGSSLSVSSASSGGSLYVGSNAIGYATRSSGRLVVRNGGVASTRGIYIGETGTGSLDVSGLGSSLSNAGVIYIGKDRDTTRSLPGSGSASVSSGGAVTTSSTTVGQLGGTGTLIVAGTGSSWTSSNGMTLGYRFSGTGVSLSPSMGTLLVSAGGNVSMPSGALDVGNQSGIGYLSISGAASIVSTGTTPVTGSSDIAIPGANHTTGDDAAGYPAQRGTASITAGGVLSASGNINVAYSGGTGTVTASGAGSRIETRGINKELNVGSGNWTNPSTGSVYSRGAGTLSLDSGATAVGFSSLYVGRSGGVGTLSVDGAGSGGQFASSVVAGESTNSTSAFADGTLLITNGGTLGTSYLTLGEYGGVGKAYIDAAGSKLTATADLKVGFGIKASGSILYQQASGLLRITGGADVTSAGNGAMFGASGGIGELQVDGVGTTLKGTNTIGPLSIGEGYASYGSSGVAASAGKATITDGGQVSGYTTVNVGANGGLGTLSLEGVNSSITCSTLSIGGSTFSSGGAGTATVGSGALIASQDSTIGNRGGVGSVSVNGSGSQWTNSKALHVGADIAGNLGSGATLSISSGATLTNGGTLKLWPGSSNRILLSDATSTLSTGSLDLGGDGSRLVWTSGKLKLTGGSITNSGGAGVSVPAGGILAGSGTISDSVSVANGGTLSPGSSAGKLRIDGTLTLSSNAVFEVEVGGDATAVAGVNFDQIQLTGTGTTANLNGATLRVVAINPMVYGAAYTIMHNTAGGTISGLFAGLNNGSIFYVGTQKMQIEYTGYDVTLSPVPEPGVCSMFAALPLLRRRRR